MGQIIELRTRREAAKASGKWPRDLQTEKPEQSAQVLFFTGVRYERPVSAPSDRLKALAATKHSV